MPLDNGAAFGRWSTHFINRTIAVFSALLTVNLFYIVCPIFMTINFFGSHAQFFNSIVQTVFVIALMSSMAAIDKMFMEVLLGEKAKGTISEMGGDIQKSTMEAAQNVGRAAMTTGRLAVNTVGAAGRLVGAGISGIGGLVSAGREHGERRERVHQRAHQRGFF